MKRISRSAIVEHSAAQMYALVEDIESYPAFLPWCASTQVHERTPDTTRVCLRNGFDATKLYAGHEDKAKIYPYWKVWIDPTQANEVATMQTNIDSYVQQNALQFVTGSKNIDTDWDAYIKGLDGLGLKRYLEIQQTAYDKMPNK